MHKGMLVVIKVCTPTEAVSQPPKTCIVSKVTNTHCGYLL